jgi:hypothetical protein
MRGVSARAASIAEASGVEGIAASSGSEGVHAILSWRACATHFWVVSQQTNPCSIAHGQGRPSSPSGSTQPSGAATSTASKSVSQRTAATHSYNERKRRA